MTKEQIQKIATMSSGTIGKALDTHLYNEIDKFIQWLFRPLDDGMICGQLVSFGENLSIALSNAVKVYNRHYRRR